MKHFSQPVVVILFLVLVAPVSLFAQKKGEKSLPADCGWFFTNKMFKTGNIVVGQICYSLKKQGVGFLNEAGKPAGDVPVDGAVLSLGITKEGVIVFYTKEYNFMRDYSEKIKEIHAMLIDPKDRKIITDKLVYQQQPARFLEVRPVNDPDGNFDFLCVAVESKNETRQYDAVNCVYLSKDLSPTVKELHTACAGGGLMEIASDGKGNFYLASHLVDQISVEKFSRDGALVEKLATTADIRKHYFVNSAMHVDMISDKPVLLSAVYTSQATKDGRKCFYSFDFNSHKVAQAANVELDNACKKQLRQEHKELTSSMVYHLDYLQPLSIIVSGDKIITVGEIEFNYFTGDKGQGAPSCEGGAAFVCVYDKSLKLQKEYVLNKFTDVSKFIKGMSSHLKDDKLYLISYELSGVNSWSLYLYTVDFAKGSVDKKKLDVKGVYGTLVAANSVFWSGDDCLIGHMIEGAMFSTKMSTVFLWMKYEDYK